MVAGERASGETRRAGGENRSYGADRTDGRRVRCGRTRRGEGDWSWGALSRLGGGWMHRALPQAGIGVP